MKTINLKFEQVTTRKGVTTINSITSKAIEFKNADSNLHIAFTFIQSIKETIEVVTSLGLKSFKIGGQNFSLSKKFNFYVSIDGQDFCLDSLISEQGLFKLDAMQGTFKKLDGLGVQLFAILQGAEGKKLVGNGVTADSFLLS